MKVEGFLDGRMGESFFLQSSLLPFFLASLRPCVKFITLNFSAFANQMIPHPPTQTALLVMVGL